MLGTSCLRFVHESQGHRVTRRRRGVAEGSGVPRLDCRELPGLISSGAFVGCAVSPAQQCQPSHCGNGGDEHSGAAAVSEQCLQSTSRTVHGHARTGANDTLTRPLSPRGALTPSYSGTATRRCTRPQLFA